MYDRIDDGRTTVWLWRPVGRDSIMDRLASYQLENEELRRANAFLQAQVLQLLRDQEERQGG